MNDNFNKSKFNYDIANKCPNCGASIKSYTSSCPYCDSEIRNIKSSETMLNFFEGLEKIKSKEIKVENRESLLKQVIGIDLSSSNSIVDVEKIRNDEIASYIKNYPVPNSKEDLIEFMIVATSNITAEKYSTDVIEGAWNSKMEQIYKKSQLTLKNQSEMKTIEDLYKSKKQELKASKVDSAFLLLGFFVVNIGLLICLSNRFYGLAFIFFSLGVMTFLYYLIKGEGATIFKSPITMKKRPVVIISIVFIVISLIFAIGWVIKSNIKSDGEKNYYNKEVEKYKVNVAIDFDGNLIFNKYDVKLSIYDQEIYLEHGKDKCFELELPKGKHSLIFSGDGKEEQVEIEIKGDTKVKYKLSCHSNEIRVSELEIEYDDNTSENIEETKESKEK